MVEMTDGRKKLVHCNNLPYMYITVQQQIICHMQKHKDFL